MLSPLDILSFNPELSIPDRKPRGDVVQTNPRISSQYLLNGSLVDIANGSSGTLTASAVWAVTHEGIALNCPNVDESGLVFPSNFVGHEEGTIIVSFIPESVVTNLAMIFDTDGARHNLYENAGQVLMFVDGRQYAWNTTFVVGTRITLGIRYSKAIDLMDYFIGGVKQSPAGNSGIWGSTAPGTNAYLGRRYTGAFKTNKKFISCIVSKEFMTDYEIISLTRNPYQGIAPVGSVAAAAGVTIPLLLKDMEGGFGRMNGGFING